MSCGNVEQGVFGKHVGSLGNDECVVPCPYRTRTSSDGGPSSNEQFGTFFIGYSYMATLSTHDISLGCRGPKFNCHLCDYYLPTRLSMITHMKMHRLPFCPVCFGMFHQALDVNYHMVESHPEVTQIAGMPILIAPGTPVGEESFALHTEAPPNSPNHNESGCNPDELGAPMDQNNNAISCLLAVKLREHQQAVDLQENNQNDSVTVAQKVVQPTERSPRYSDKKSSMSGGSTGKVHRGSSRKCPPKLVAGKGQATAARGEEHVLKVTSRFGRAISLKIPQF